MTNSDLSFCLPSRVHALAALFLAVGCAITQGGQPASKGARLAVVVGSGETLDKAKDSALLAAVEAINGLRMTSTSQLTNDDLQEKTEKYSAGHVESFELLKSSTLPDGTLTVTVAAWVKRQLVESASPAVAPSQEMKVSSDAENLRAQVYTKAKAQEQAALFVKNATRSIGPHSITAKFVTKLDTAVPMRERGEEEAPGQTWLKCQLAIGMYRDKKSIGGPVAALRELLSEASLMSEHFSAQETSIGVQLVNINPDGHPEAYTQTISGLISVSWQKCRHLIGDTPVDVVMLMKRDGSEHHEFDAYVLPAAVWESMAAELNQFAQNPLAVELDLRDKQDSSILRLEAPLDSRIWGWSATRHGIALCQQSVQLRSGRSRVLLLGEDIMFFQGKEGQLLADNELVMDLRFELPVDALRQMDRFRLQCAPASEGSRGWRDMDINRVRLGDRIGIPCRANLHLVDTGPESGLFLTN